MEAIQEHLGVVVDYRRDRDIPEKGLSLLTKSGFYKKEWEDSPQQGFSRAATCYSFGDYEFAQRIYDYASKGWFTNASPVLSNAVEVNWPSFGKDQFQEAGDWLEENVDPDGQPISCFLSCVGDKRKWLTEASTETRNLSMAGGGIGVYMGNRAPDEKSTGVLAHLRGYDADALAYKQTATRRGSIAAYMDIDHPEILSFIEMRNPTGGDSNKKCFNLNNAVNIPDSFMNAVILGEEYELVDPKHGPTGRMLPAQEVWEKLMQTRFETGEPYLNFIDTVNRNIPKWITKPTYQVSQSNLCVAPETPILHEGGYTPIAELEGSVVNVWNGEEFTTTKVVKTSDDSKLLRVVTSSGQELECTEYHKFYVQLGYGGSVVEKRTHELKSGDKLIKFELPVIQGHKDLHKGYQNGFFSGDGCTVKGKSRIYLYHDKRELEGNFDLEQRYDQEDLKRVYGYESGLKPKFFVPTSEYSVESRLDWLAGLCDADGTIARNGTNESLQLCSIEKEFLKEIQLMLQTVGVTSKVTKNTEAGVRLLPANNGSGELREFDCSASYRLLVSSSGLYKLSQLGFQCQRLTWEVRKPQRNAEQFVQVVSVIDEGRYDETYCFTESKRGMGVFGGILTGQCSEITLMTSNKRTAVCCLSSLNLDKYDEWKDTNIVQDLVRYLDNVLEYFIRLAPKELKRAVYSAQKERAIGLGTLGYHSYLQRHRIPFESGGFNSAASVTHQIYSDIKAKAVESSKQLAVERGEPDDCYGSGMRNSHLMAIAPNASSSDMVGVSPSIEPWAANAFLSEGRAGSFLIKNPHLMGALEELGMNTKEVWDKVVADSGSVQNIDGLPPWIKSVYKTFSEIDPKWVVELAAIRQPEICQSQSLNIKVRKDITMKEMSDIHMLAWHKEVKTLYYCRAERAGKVDMKGDNTQPLNKVDVNINFETCLSCEG